MQKQADMITPAERGLLRALHRPDGDERLRDPPLRLGRRRSPRTTRCGSRALGISWDPSADGRTVVRLNGGLFYGRVPGLALASSRSTNGSRGAERCSATASSTASASRRPTYPNLLPAEAGQGVPDHPGVFVFDEDFQNPRTWSASASRRARAGDGRRVPAVQYNYAKGEHITRFFEQNDTAFGCPWGTGLEPGGPNGISCGSSGGGGLTSVESTAKSSYNGLTFGLTKRWSNNYQFQVNYTTVLGQVGRRQRARPVHATATSATTTWTPSTATRTATSATG